jgi:hypothetical protein
MFGSSVCNTLILTTMKSEFGEVLFMKIEYRKADITDAELLIDIYNFAFYSDYIKYGECPAYGKTKEMMVGAWLIGF